MFVNIEMLKLLSRAALQFSTLCVTNKDESFQPNLHALYIFGNLWHQNEISSVLELAFYSFLLHQDTI